MTTNDDQYVPDDDQVRGRYCDGTYLQTGHTTEGDDFDAWLARVRREAWQEGYHQGAEDGITSEQAQVGIGLGGIARPARTNPYEETP